MRGKMLGVSRWLLSKETYHTKVEGSTCIKTSLFILNFLPLILAVLAIQGSIQVSKRTAQALCGIGIPLTLLALIKDVCSDHCCPRSSQSLYSQKTYSQPNTSNQHPQVQGLDPTQSKQLQEATQKVTTLMARLQTLKQKHSFQDRDDQLYSNLHTIWEDIQKAGKGDGDAISALPLQIPTLETLEGPIAETEAQVARSAKAAEYRAIMTRIEALRQELEQKKASGTEKEKSAATSLLKDFPKKEQMENDLSRIQGGLNLNDLSGILAQRETNLYQQKEIHFPVKSSS